MKYKGVSMKSYSALYLVMLTVLLGVIYFL